MTAANRPSRLIFSTNVSSFILYSGRWVHEDKAVYLILNSGIVVALNE